ncbi:MAG TPA: hypothetical protein DCE41_01210 [Cytophagales bacterium]|nr:hypothetical protein [Cytophagales bacterium]
MRWVTIHRADIMISFVTALVTALGVWNQARISASNSERELERLSFRVDDLFNQLETKTNLLHGLESILEEKDSWIDTMTFMTGERRFEIVELNAMIIGLKGDLEKEKQNASFLRNKIIDQDDDGKDQLIESLTQITILKENIDSLSSILSNDRAIEQQMQFENSKLKSEIAQMDYLIKLLFEGIEKESFADTYEGPQDRRRVNNLYDYAIRNYKSVQDQSDLNFGKIIQIVEEKKANYNNRFKD